MRSHRRQTAPIGRSRPKRGGNARSCRAASRSSFSCSRPCSARKFGYQRYFFQQQMDIEDDHLPFVERGVPSIEIIDLDYGPNNSYHHTAQDKMDKISAHSLMIDGDVFMESIRLIDQR
ncbi:MAG: M28 family peptidase [Isosphaeraceae bacterium]